MAAILARSKHTGIYGSSATLLGTVGNDAALLRHSDPVGQDMVYSQICRLIIQMAPAKDCLKRGTERVLC